MRYDINNPDRYYPAKPPSDEPLGKHHLGVPRGKGGVSCGSLKETAVVLLITRIRLLAAVRLHRNTPPGTDPQPPPFH